MARSIRVKRIRRVSRKRKQQGGAHIYESIKTPTQSFRRSSKRDRSGTYNKRHNKKVSMTLKTLKKNKNIIVRKIVDKMNAPPLPPARARAPAPARVVKKAPIALVKKL